MSSRHRLTITGDATETPGSPRAAQRLSPQASTFIALQRLAGNRAVSSLLHQEADGTAVPIQRWTPVRVGYSEGSPAGNAIRFRRQQGNWDSQPNVAVLLEDDTITTTRLSAGEGLHAEKLVLGETIQQRQPQQNLNTASDFGAYKVGRTTAAAIYTERQPCSECSGILDHALRDEEKVYFSIHLGEPAQMSWTLAHLIAAVEWERSAAEAAVRSARYRPPGQTLAATIPRPARKGGGPPATASPQGIQKSRACPVCGRNVKLTRDGNLAKHPNESEWIQESRIGGSNTRGFVNPPKQKHPSCLGGGHSVKHAAEIAEAIRRKRGQT